MVKKPQPPNLDEWMQRYGYNCIPWKEWDAAVETYQRERREYVPELEVERDPALDFYFVPEDPPKDVCCVCKQPAHFGYRGEGAIMRWFCAEHRLAKYWADARQ